LYEYSKNQHEIPINDPIYYQTDKHILLNFQYTAPKQTENAGHTLTLKHIFTVGDKKQGEENRYETSNCLQMIVAVHFHH
jgi:hypothetical protein